jgi:hypothetical protein
MATNDNPNLSRSTLPQSRLGIAGFITGLLSICILVSYLVFLFFVLKSTDDFGLSIYQRIPAILIFVLCATLLLSLITLVLGIISLFQKRHKKLFAILAIVEWVVSVLLLIISFFTFFIFTS